MSDESQSSEPRSWPDVFAFDLNGLCDFVAFVSGRVLEHCGHDEARVEDYEVVANAVQDYLNGRLAQIDAEVDRAAFAASVRADLEALESLPEHRPEFG